MCVDVRHTKALGDMKEMAGRLEISQRPKSFATLSARVISSADGAAPVPSFRGLEEVFPPV